MAVSFKQKSITDPDDRRDMAALKSLGESKYISIEEIKRRGTEVMKKDALTHTLEQKKSIKSIDEQVDLWLSDFPPRKTVTKKKILDEFEEEIEQKKVIWVKRQSAVKFAIDCVKERVSDLSYGLDTFYKQRIHRLEEKEEFKKTLVEDGSFQYSLKSGQMEWKHDLLYLEPKYHNVAAKYQHAIGKVVSKDLKRRLEILLNDYRRMHLHSKFLTDTDPNPKHLDDVRVWIQDTTTKDEPEREVDTHLKQIKVSACEDLLEVKDLQSQIIDLRQEFNRAAETTRASVLQEHKKVLKAQAASEVKADVSILEQFKLEPLTARFTELLDGFMQEEERLGEQKEAVEKLKVKIADLEVNLAEADKFASTSKADPKILKESIFMFMEKFTPDLIKTVEPLYSTLEKMLDAESEQISAIDENRKACLDLEIRVQKYKVKLSKEKDSKPYSNKDDFILSEMANKSTNRDLTSVVSVVVAAIDRYQDTASATYVRAIERLTEERKNLKQKAGGMGVGAGDQIKEAYSSLTKEAILEEDTSKHAKVLLAFKVIDYIISEFGRVINDSHKRTLDTILEEHKRLFLETELVNIAGPMIKKNIAEKMKEAEKQRAIKQKRKEEERAKKDASAAKNPKKSASRRESTGSRRDSHRASRTISKETQGSSKKKDKHTNEESNQDKPDTHDSNSPSAAKSPTPNEKHKRKQTMKAKPNADTKHDAKMDKQVKKSLGSSKSSKGHRESKTSTQHGHQEHMQTMYSEPVSRESSDADVFSSHRESKTSAQHGHQEHMLTMYSKPVSRESSYADVFSNAVPGPVNHLSLSPNKLYQSRSGNDNVYTVSDRRTVTIHERRIDGTIFRTQLPMALYHVHRDTHDLELTINELRHLRGNSDDIEFAPYMTHSESCIVEDFEFFRAAWVREHKTDALLMQYLTQSTLEGDLFHLRLLAHARGLAPRTTSKMPHGKSGHPNSMQKHKRHSALHKPPRTAPIYERNPRKSQAAGASGLKFMFFVNSRPVYQNHQGQYVDHDRNIFDVGKQNMKRDLSVCQNRLKNEVVLPSIARPLLGMVKGKRFGPRFDPCQEILAAQHGKAPTAAKVVKKKGQKPVSDSSGPSVVSDED